MTDKLDAGAKTLSLISHKLRTPLSIINGYCEAISLQKDKEKFTPFTDKAFEEITKQGTKLGVLVDKLLKFTRMETIDSPSQIDKSEANLREVVIRGVKKGILTEDSPEAVKETADFITKGPTKIEILAPADLNIMVDETLLANVIHELIENAIKFNNKLERYVKVYCFKHSSYVSISVKDAGSGIRPGEINKIFDKFYQIDEFFTGQIEGWGLGLPYVKKVMDLHGGSVSVVSDYGLGSVFSINIPN